MNQKKVYLSASRIKTAQQCSWTYWCKYILKLPDRSNDGASKGSICHLILELLGRGDRRALFDELTSNGTIWDSPAIKRLVIYHAKKLGVNDQENLDDIDKMMINGLNYDFFGNDKDGLEKEFSEKSFALSVDLGESHYNIRGFIDKLFLYKDKTALIRDFKTSKQKFKGKEISDNMQDLMYCLAVKKLYPEYKGLSEFLFLKFDLDKDLFGSRGSGAIRMKELSEKTLEGFEHELASIQDYLETFDKDKARSNYAGAQGYPKDGTFGGPLACGKDGFKMSKGKEVLDKDGNPIKAFICAFRKPFKYYCLLDEYGEVKKSVHKGEEPSLEKIKCPSDTIEEREYEGCPHWKGPNEI
jgi:hypothetical protein